MQNQPGRPSDAAIHGLCPNENVVTPNTLADCVCDVSVDKSHLRDMTAYVLCQTIDFSLDAARVYLLPRASGILCALDAPTSGQQPGFCGDEAVVASMLGNLSNRCLGLSIGGAKQLVVSGSSALNGKTDSCIDKTKLVVRPVARLRTP